MRPIELPRARRFLAFLAFALAFASWPALARASTTYPQDVADALGSPCVPQCTICHRDNVGGLATVVQPFGFAMIANGLRFFAPETVAPALERVRAAGIDSDGDGVGDVDELAQGQDPNGDLDLCGLAPRYGCGAHIAPVPRRGVSSYGVIAAGLVLGLSLRRIFKARRGGP